MNEPERSPEPENVRDMDAELALQNVIRKRHCKDWPNVVLQLTKRVQAVNQTWAKIIMQLMTIPGLSVTFSGHDDHGMMVVVKFRHPDGGVPVEEVEVHEITVKELHDARQYIEVLLMDKLDHSELIARIEAQHQAKTSELPA